MLCPEVWNFQPPPCTFSSVLVKDDDKLLKMAKSQYFNYLVAITLPNFSQPPQKLIELVTEDSTFYRVNNVHSSEFVKKQFIDLFIKNGSLTLLSIGTHLDQDDCVVITPHGKLIFSLRRQSYQELGIEGKPTEFGSKEPEKYLINIDLKSDCFCPGKKNYENVLEKLSDRKDMSFDVILAWEPGDEKVCPSSIAAYFARNYKVKTCNLVSDSRTDKNISVPDFEDEDDAEELTEWLGAYSLNCDIPDEADGYLSDYQAPSNSNKFETVTYLQWKGLFTINRMEKIVRLLREITTNASSPWISLNVHGFENSVVNRNEQEHHYYVAGDYHYTIFFKSNHPSLLFSFISSTRKPISVVKKRKKR